MLIPSFNCPDQKLSLTKLLYIPKRFQNHEKMIELHTKNFYYLDHSKMTSMLVKILWTTYRLQLLNVGYVRRIFPYVFRKPNLLILQ